MNHRSWLVFWITLGLAALYLLVVMLPPSDPPDKMQLVRAGRLMASEGGRFQPLDSYARTQMMRMSKRQDYQDVSERTQPAVRWLFDTLASGLAHYYAVLQHVSVEDAELLRFLELKPRENKVYRASEIAAKPQFQTEAERIRKLFHQRDELNAFDQKMLRLTMQVLYGMQHLNYAQTIQKELDKRQVDKSPIFRVENDQVLVMLGLPRRSGLRYGWAEIRGAKGFGQFLRRAEQAGERSEKTWDLLDGKTVELHRQLQPYNEVENLTGMLLVPPASDAPDAPWQKLGPALMHADGMGGENAHATALENLVRAYGMGEVEKFNELLASYEKVLEERYPSEMHVVRFEAWFNSFAPFYQCMLICVVAFLLVCVSWVSWKEVLNLAAFGLLGLALVVMTFALLARMYIQWRPPVTNLYSSAVFIGWGAILICLYLEYLFKLGVGNLIGSVLGFLTTLVAHHLAASGDTLEMMQAVLDTNFWLATHVVCVTLGYVATFVAGFVAIVYTVRGLFTTSLDQTTAKTLTQMTYGLICFATLLSFVGTVLGGIWADQSWGRFWGWDPKENGALLIVVMNALILHARWGGIVRDRGIAILAMCGNMITLWSWFGTNQLGIGLHAYGVNKTLVNVCRYSWIFQGLLIGIAALVPQSSWLSFRPGGKPPVTERPRRDRKSPAAAPAKRCGDCFPPPAGIQSPRRGTALGGAAVPPLVSTHCFIPWRRCNDDTALCAPWAAARGPGRRVRAGPSRERPEGR